MNAPPNDEALETNLLGIILLLKDSLDEIIGEIKSADVFYQPKNKVIYETILALHGAFKPVDLTTITAELRLLKKIDNAGGLMYITRLSDNAIQLSNWRNYISRLNDLYVTRSLISFSQELQSKCFNPDWDTKELISEAEQKLTKITQNVIKNSIATSKQLYKEQLDFNDKLLANKGKILGLTTGFSNLDREIGGFQNSDLIILAARSGMGKCLGKGTPILMYDGSIKKVEDIAVGDLIMGDDSTKRTVLSTTRGTEEMFEIIPKKGDKWVCNRSHILSLRMSSNGSYQKKGDIVNISIHDYLQKPDKFKHHAKLYKVPIQYKEQLVDVHPYLFGLWLGDGGFRDPRIHNPEPEIHAWLQSNYETSLHIHKKSLLETFTVKKNPLFRLLISNSTKTGEKRICKEYLINSRVNRLQLLAGIIDTDGHYISGCYEISTKYDGLKDDILYLCRSLGFQATARQKISSIKSTGFVGIYWRIFISGEISDIPCKVKRKIATKRNMNKNVLNCGFTVRSIDEGEYYGFEIDGNRLFVLGDFTVTHNTALSLKLLADPALMGDPTAIFCLEMDNRKLFARIIAQQTDIYISKLLRDGMNEYDLQNLIAKGDLLCKANIFFDDTPAMTIFEVCNKARQLKRKHNIKLLIIDYLQLIVNPVKGGTRENEVSQIARALKNLAKELDIPIIALSQLSRQSGDGKPMLHHLRESGDLEASADQVIFIHRPEYYGNALMSDGTTPSSGLAEIIFAKNRNGALIETVVGWDGAHTKFYELNK